VVKPPSLSVQSVVQWLVHGARNAPLSQEVLTELCERLTAAGLPLWRVTVFVRTLHPEIVGRRFVWRPETGTVVTDGSFELLERRSFLDSPTAHVSNTGEAFRRRLADPDCVMDYPVLHDLRNEGVTDYVVAPLHFSGGEVHFSSWATLQPGGFTDAETEAIQSLIAPLARVAEIRAWYRVAGNLLTTYVGKNAGERVLAGHIRRGDTEAIHAAIWLSDMRGFTTLADALPPQDLVDLLNRYFSTARCRRSSSMAAKCSNIWAMDCWRSFRSAPSTISRRSAPPHWKPAERRAIRLPRCVRATAMAAARALVWRCMSATCCSAISAAATGWTSLASARR
jgi:hypothetical protein